MWGGLFVSPLPRFVYIRNSKVKNWTLTNLNYHLTLKQALYFQGLTARAGQCPSEVFRDLVIISFMLRDLQEKERDKVGTDEAKALEKCLQKRHLPEAEVLRAAGIGSWESLRLTITKTVTQ